MKQVSTFVITEFANPSGQIVYRVAGYLNGERVRRNFANRAEADAEKSVLEIKALQAETGIRVAATRLTDEELHEAEAAFARLKAAPKSLLFYVDYALTNYRPPEREKPLADAIADYRAARQRDHERTLLSIRQVLAIKYELANLQKRFPNALISRLTPDELTLYLERGKPSLKTYNNRRGIVSTLCKYAVQKGWLASNPIEKTTHFRINHRRGSAVTISAERTAELLEFVETFDDGKLVPYFAICLFAGVRPCIRYGEITKLKPESVRLDTGVIRIEPEVSKVRMPRLVTIQPNLAVWLKTFPLKATIVPKNATNTRRVVFARFGLTHDVLRHTFISMFVAKFRSMGEAALQAGNSESIIRKHYLDLKSKEEAERFFAIIPRRKTTTTTLAA